MEAPLLPVDVDTESTCPTAGDYQQELIPTLSSVGETALKSIDKAQGEYKASYDCKTDDNSYIVPSRGLGAYLVYQ